MIDADKIAKDAAELRQRDIAIHLNRPNQCGYCYNSALVLVTDGKNEFVFICDKCRSNDFFQYPEKHFKKWNSIRYPSFTVRSALEKK